MNYAEATERFLESQDEWLTDEDLPAALQITHLAMFLDEDPGPWYMHQYGQAYRALVKRVDKRRQEFAKNNPAA